MTKNEISKIINDNDKHICRIWQRRYSYYTVKYELKYDDLWLSWILAKYYILNSEREAYRVEIIKASYYVGD